jgi:hypothetical protein
MAERETTSILTQGEIESRAGIVRSTLEHYSRLRNDRVKTMLTLQSLMFVALGFIWDKSPAATVVIVSAGLIASFALADFLRECQRAARQLLDWWANSRLEDPEGLGPPIRLSCEFVTENPCSWCRSISLLEFAIGIAWGALLLLALKRIFITLWA